MCRQKSRNRKQKTNSIGTQEKIEVKFENINLHLKELYGVRKQYEKLERNVNP